MVLEGCRTVGEAVDAGHQPVTVLVPASSVQADDVTTVLDRLDLAVEILVVRDHVFETLAPSVSPQPMLAIVRRPVGELPSPAPADGVVLVLVDVGDPGNVGTLIRTADAVAADAVVVVGGADPWGAKAVRASAGSVLRVPVVSGIEVDDALQKLRGEGYRIVGTDVDDGEPHVGGVLTAPVAIVLGSEPHGLDRSIEPLVDAWTRIDMPGRTESLNVAMAGTLLLFEARRV